MNAKRNPRQVVGATSGANHVAGVGCFAVRNSLALTPELQAHVDRVVGSAPTFSPGQRALLSSLLGGDR